MKLGGLEEEEAGWIKVERWDDLTSRDRLKGLRALRRGTTMVAHKV